MTQREYIEDPILLPIIEELKKAARQAVLTGYARGLAECAECEYEEPPTSDPSLQALLNRLDHDAQAERNPFV